LTTEQKVEQYHQICDVNIRGVLLSMKHEIPAILRSGGGTIVNNSSTGGHIGLPGLSVYVASKFAVIGLTKTAALEFAKQGVRINSVSPGPIQTEMFDRAFGNGKNRYNVSTFDDDILAGSEGCSGRTEPNHGAGKSLPACRCGR
jgi:NAD(P)-dependent dehydrogenase (short-subunit alcohol dehydrogenase family)